MFATTLNIRKAEYLGGGVIEEMTIKPLAELSFLLCAAIKATQTLYYKVRIKIACASHHKCKGDAYIDFYSKRIAPLKEKALFSENMFFAALVAAKRNLSGPFRLKGLACEARAWRGSFHKIAGEISRDFSIPK